MCNNHQPAFENLEVWMACANWPGWTQSKFMQIKNASVLPTIMCNINMHK